MTRASSFRTSAFCLLPSALILIAAAAPQAPLPSPQFRAGVDLVRLDVSVIDKNRRPVRGLTAADFTVLEDGHEQKIVAFVPVDIPDPLPVPVVDGKPVTWVRDVAPDVQSNGGSADQPEGRLFILLIDDAMIPSDASMIKNTKKIARSVIEKLGPSDRVAVVLSGDTKGAHDFTSNKSKLLADVDKMHPGHATYFFGWDTIEDRFIHDCHPNAPVARLNDGDIQARDWSFNTLTSVAEALMAAPERRKALIYVGPGLPINPADAGPPPIGNPTDMRVGNGPPPVTNPCPFPTPPPREGAVIHEANVNLFQGLTALFRRMAQANVVMYPIDPTGLGGLTEYVRHAYGTLGKVVQYQQVNIDAAGKPIGPSVPLADDLATFTSRLSLDFLLTSASNTGGRAVVNTNDTEPGIAEIFQENSSFYLLGYQAPSADKPGTEHRLTVRVNREGAQAHTRSGYLTPKPDKVDPNHPVTPTAKAVASLLPSAALPLKVALAPLGWPAGVPLPKSAKPGSLAMVSVVLGLERPAIGKPMSDTVEVQISAFTPDGVAQGTAHQEAQVAIRPATPGEIVRYEALSYIELKPGRYQLRIAAYSAVSDVTGSVFAEVDVPDFAGEAVSLSGVLIETSPTVPSAPRDTLARIVALIPTSERAFQKLDRAAAFVRLYQGGKAPLAPVTLVTRIVNSRDEAVLNRSETWSPDRFNAATRSADCRLEIPTLTLLRGEYLLTFEATLGASIPAKPEPRAMVARRDVRFTVR
jgi:VWFA-related protein